MTRYTAPSVFLFGLWAATPVAAWASETGLTMPIQVTETSLSAEQPPPPGPGAPKTRADKVAGVFAPAPMPDQDFDPPSGTTARGPSLSPALFSHKAEFAGDGFSAASDADHGLDHRRAPAAGLNWSVPVK